MNLPTATLVKPITDVPTPNPPRAKRFSIEEYHRLTEIGFFQENDRVELIRGELIEMAAKGTKHIFCCQELSSTLPLLLSKQAISRCQEPIVLLGGSEPEPDFAIVQLTSDRYRTTKPEAQDILVVIEVSDSSLAYDRTVKATLYAEAGIQHYWIFNVFDQQLEVLQNPFQNSKGEFEYGLKQIHPMSATVALPAPLMGSIVLADVLP
jgi:Uma2 family endonuclease